MATDTTSFVYILAVVIFSIPCLTNFLLAGSNQPISRDDLLLARRDRLSRPLISGPARVGLPAHVIHVAQRDSLFFLPLPRAGRSPLHVFAGPGAHSQGRHAAVQRVHGGRQRLHVRGDHAVRLAPRSLLPLRRHRRLFLARISETRSSRFSLLVRQNPRVSRHVSLRAAEEITAGLNRLTHWGVVDAVRGCMRGSLNVLW